MEFSYIRKEQNITHAYKQRTNWRKKKKITYCMIKNKEQSIVYAYKLRTWVGVFVYEE